MKYLKIFESFTSDKLEEQIEVITNYIIQILDGRIEDRKQRQIREQEAVRLDYIKKFNDGIRDFN
jgi:hypothetical protein